MSKLETLEEQIAYNIKRRDEMLVVGGIGELMTAEKFQQRIDSLIEKIKQVRDEIIASEENT